MNQDDRFRYWDKAAESLFDGLNMDPSMLLERALGCTLYT